MTVGACNRPIRLTQNPLFVSFFRDVDGRLQYKYVATDDDGHKEVNNHQVTPSIVHNIIP